MQYTVITLVDGDRVATNRFVEEQNLAYHTGLHGADLLIFRASLRTSGQAMDVTRDACGVTVIIAHEEI